MYREVWVAGRGRDRRSLETTDRTEADRRGKLLYAELLKEQAPLVAGAVRLRRLWEEFRTRSQRFLDNKPRTQRDAETRAATLIGFFGEDCDVRRLTPDDQLRYQRQRVAGGIRYTRDGVFRNDEHGRETDEPEEFVPPATRARSAESDLVLLHTMLTCATTHRTPEGRFWLDVNPLRGVSRAPEKNPVRPVTTWDRFVATRTAMQRLAAQGEPGSGGWVPWVKMELALVLAEVTGLWHPYRRKWAMERKHWPLSDVAAVGGWKDVETLLKCYSQADRRTMLSVMSEPTKLRSADVSAARSTRPEVAPRLVGMPH